MKLDEFAFVNRQLAGMLKSGIPLEGALRQLCTGLERGELRAELTALEADLAKGTPLADALDRRQLPELYRRMLLVGVKSGDLPGVLILLADYYTRMNTLWTQLKGLMVYPVIVLAGLTLVSIGLALAASTLLSGQDGLLQGVFLMGDGERTERVVALMLWFPVGLLALLGSSVTALLVTPGLRRWAKWKLPPFREASYARLAGALQLLLQHGCPLPEAIALVEKLEADSPIAPELARWQQALREGRAKPGDFISGPSAFPPLFRVLLCEAGNDLAHGFARAAETYHARASARADLLLHAALPAAVILLGGLLLTQLLGPFYALSRMMEALGS